MTQKQIQEIQSEREGLAQTSAYHWENAASQVLWKNCDYKRLMTNFTTQILIFVLFSINQFELE